jgi:phosphoserine phosphatase RsbU/P
MKILLAEDEPTSRARLEHVVRGWGHDVVAVADGLAAWQMLEREDAPQLAILDWMMPEFDGLELCRRVRALARPAPTYLILLTARQSAEDVVLGLDSGANDFVSKPFDRRELRARVQVGERVVSLQRDLAERVRELEQARTEVNHLAGLLPICCYCKSVRSDENYWQKVETYLATRADVHFSHGICPDCYQKVVIPDLAAAGCVFSADDLNQLPC